MIVVCFVRVDHVDVHTDAPVLSRMDGYPIRQFVSDQICPIWQNWDHR